MGKNRHILDNPQQQTGIRRATGACYQHALLLPVLLLRSQLLATIQHWRCYGNLPAARYRSNSECTAAALNASPCSSCAPPALGPRCLGSARGVTAGGFQSARAARDDFPQAAT